MNRAKVIGLWAAAIWSWGSATTAQEPSIYPYGANQGFDHSAVRDLGQDRDGALCLAGEAGLSCYDGLNLERHPLPEDLTWAGLQFLRRDAEDAWWMLTAHRPFPVLRYQDGAFSALPLAPLPSSETRVTGFEVPAGDPAQVAFASSHGLFLYSGKQWRHLTSVDGLPDDSLTAMTQWQGRLLVAGPAGIAVIRSGMVDAGLNQRLAQAPSSFIQALAAGRDPASPRLWLVGDSWLGTLTESGFQLVAENQPLLDFSTGAEPWRVSAAADDLGGLYIAAGDQLLYFHPDRGFETPISDSLALGVLNRVLVDLAGRVWVAGERGLVRVSSRRLMTYQGSRDLFAEATTAMLELRDGRVAVGHQGGLSLVADDGRVTTRSLALTSADGTGLGSVTSLAETDDGTLWMSLGELGVGEWRQGQFRRYLPSGEARISAVAVEPLSRDLWLSGDHGLYRRQGQTFEKVTRPGLDEIQPTGIKGDSKGLWVFHRQGLSLLSGRAPSEDRHWRVPSRLNLEIRDAVHAWNPQSADPWVWVATDQGLYMGQADDTRLQPFDGLKIDVALNFVGDHRGVLWVGSDHGIGRYRPLAGEQLETMCSHQGLAGDRTTRRGFLVDGMGRLWIGTDNGISVFDSRFEQSTTEPPVVRLVELRSGDLSWPLDQAQTVPAGRRRLDLVFRSVSLVDVENVHFRTRLEGWDDDWTAPFRSADQTVRYFDLPAGKYRFHIQAQGQGGEWGPISSSKTLTLLGPFWQQTWFFVSLGTLLLAGIFALQTFWTQRRHSRSLESEVARRVAELQATEDRYRKTFRTIEDGLVTTDERGRVALLNPRAQELTGWSEADAVGQDVEKVLRLFQRGATDPVAGDELALAGSGSRDGEPMLLSSNLQDTIGPIQTAFLESRVGRRLLVELTSAPIVSRGVGFAGMVFTFRDISRKAEIEAELARAQKLEAIGLLAGGIAHDFNNLLTVILGNLSLIQDSADDSGPEAGILEDAENALLRAQDLTQQLLTFSRGGAPVREAASIFQVIEDSASFVLSGSKIRFELDLDPQLHVVEIDSGQISQVLNNLLINAGQAMPDGGSVKISGRNTSNPPHPLPAGLYVAIDVADSGIGIPEHLIHRVFDPYFSTKQEGRGLGLASAYSIIKKHEGLLTVHSALGEGTTFRILLPASKQQPAGTAGQVENPGPPIEGGRILVMDDDAVVRRTASVMLDRLGFEVVAAQDGHEALNLYARYMDGGRPFTAVMMDLTVPGGMGGQEAIQHIMQLDPEVRGIVYSGYSNDPVLANYRDYGFRGRLSKPFRLKDLRAVVREVLSESSPHASEPSSHASEPSPHASEPSSHASEPSPHASEPSSQG